MFDRIDKDDICMAFFPCVRFSVQIELEFRAGSYQGQMWSDEKNLEYDIKLHKERDMLYEKISQLAIVAIRKKIKMIIENPYDARHYLVQYWCLKPALIDNNRQLNGDYYKKPTQYFFLNCEPKNNFLFEAMEYVEPNKIKCGKRIGNNNIQVSRSMIHPQYADRFIRQQILEEEQYENKVDAEGCSLLDRVHQQTIAETIGGRCDEVASANHDELHQESLNVSRENGSKR